MPNPRQRKNNKNGGSGGKPNANGLRRLHTKMNKAPTMKGPLALQQGWDKKKTVRQNYEALGLLTSIPLDQSSNSTSKQSIKEAEENLISGYGRIVRDAKGNVVDVILPEDDNEQEAGKEGETVGEDSDEEEKEVALVPAKTEVVKTLEILSSTATPVKRHTSTSEKEWLTQLVVKYGDDRAAMARDPKLNVWQKTSGEIGRMIKKAGGVEKLKQRAAREGGSMDLA